MSRYDFSDMNEWIGCVHWCQEKKIPASYAIGLLHYYVDAMLEYDLEFYDVYRSTSSIDHFFLHGVDVAK